MARGRERNFDYTPSYEDTVEIAEQRASYDTLFKEVKMFKPRQGANLVRIAPPTWRDARHYGLLIKLHRDVGPRDRQYLCPKENEWSPEKRCPICDALFDRGTRVTQDEKRALSPQDGYIYYIIDRDAEKEGIQLWQASLTTNAEIAAQSMNRRTRAVLNITHVDHGYDLEFTRTGTTRNNTRYRGFHIMHEPSPFADDNRDFDRWIDEVCDRPLPEILNFYSYEHIESVFTGRGASSEERRGRDRDERDTRGREEEDRPRRTREEDEPRRGRDVQEEDRPRDRRTREEDEPRPSRYREEDEPRQTRDRGEERPSRNREPEEDDPPRDRGRTRLSRDLDDEIPSDGGRRARSNGRDDGNGEVAPEKPRRARLDSGNGSERTGTAERETRGQERPTRGEEPEERRGGRYEEDTGESSRERARNRMNREVNRD